MKTCSRYLRQYWSFHAYHATYKRVDDDKKDTEYYFELRILEDEITKDVSLMVVDFAEEDELDESRLLWENQISDLKHVIGSI